MVWFYYYYYYFTQRFTHVRKVDERVKPQGFLVLFFFFRIFAYVVDKTDVTLHSIVTFFFFLPIVIYTSFLAFFFSFSLALISVSAPLLCQ